MRKKPMESERESGLPPIVSFEARLLILGSFPSPASLRAGQYYGHPRNQFWPLLGAVFGETLAEIPYAERVFCVIKRRVAIWDVLQSCVRPGALDADIRLGLRNNFEDFFARLPCLERLCFNGKTSGKFARSLAGLYADLHGGEPECFVLPSSSMAYTLPFAEKLVLWRKALAPCAECPPSV
ncbi:MAG: DNA-deoxyinosine glycosylase [Zoogloeaceae bacterium]|nr:DNA-deoxyinosine glycosylase [Zoogloeaceae bacterium]